MKRHSQADVPELAVCNNVLEKVINTARTAPLAPSLPGEIRQAMHFAEYEPYWNQHHGVFQAGLFKRYRANCKAIAELALHHGGHGTWSEEASAAETEEGPGSEAAEVMTEAIEELELSGEMYDQLETKLNALEPMPFYLVYLTEGGIGHVQGFDDHRALKLYAQQHPDLGEPGVLEPDEDGNAQLTVLRSFVEAHSLKLR